MLFIDILKRSRFIPVWMLFITLLTSSCEKLLEIDRPRDSLSTETTFINNDNANSALAGMYGWLMDAEGSTISFSNGGLSVFASLLSDEAYSTASNTNSEYQQFYENKLFTDNGLVLTMYWDKPYKVIYCANAILEGVAASTSVYLTDSARKQLNGEAKFVRAFAHFYLVNLFGDVPLMTKTDVTETSLYGRTPVATVYKQIEQDLKDAYLLLPDDFRVTRGSKTRPNRWAAAALLARVYLYQQRWEEAAFQANLVIESQKFQTQAPAHVFKPESSEAIWQLKHDKLKAGEHTRDAELLMPLYRFKHLPPDYQFFFLMPDFYVEVAPFLTPTVPIRTEFMSLFEPDDQRKAIWIEENPQPAEAPWNGSSYYYSAKIERVKPDLVTPGDGYLTVMRISEQYLIRAEARAQIGSDLTGAANDINVVRNKNGLGNTTAASKEALLDAVMQERAVEFFAEWGHRWFDLKRTGRAAATLGTLLHKQPWSNNALLMPIPSAEIQRNPRLKPNPGY